MSDYDLPFYEEAAKQRNIYQLNSDAKFIERWSLLKVVGITGEKGHGKDTIGAVLTTRFGYRRVAFADIMKDALQVIFGFSDEQLHGNLKDEKDEFWRVAPREIFQAFGTDLMRDRFAKLFPHIGENLWVQALRRSMLEKWRQDSTAKFVITDVRFDNEAEMITNLGGGIIRVIRPPESTSKAFYQHASEQGIHPKFVSQVIVNDTRREDLQEKVAMLFSI